MQLDTKFKENLIHLYFQGERLSHAVGCAFTACLQRKQKQVALKEQHFEVINVSCKQRSQKLLKLKLTLLCFIATS